VTRAAEPLAVARTRSDGQGIALAALCGLLFLTFLDNTIVSVALGDIQPDLHAGVTDLQWVVNGYALVFASLMLPAGAFGDKFGRKKVMLTGAAVFCVGSLICALAASPATLIAGRAVMGLGAAGSEPGTLSMLRHLYPGERERARALGVWTAVSGVALALGPVVGGALVGGGGWRSIFWFNLAAGLLLLAVSAGVLPESADPEANRVDGVGALVGATALAAAVYAVIEGENVGYSNPSVLALFVVGFVMAVAFVAWERRVAYPLLDLKFLRVPAFSIANLTAFTTYFGTFAIFFFTALYLQEVVGDSGYEIAVRFLPMMIGIVVAALVAGRWTGSQGPRVPVTVGCVLFGAGLLLTDSQLSPHPGYAGLAASLALAGVGIGLTVVPVTDAALTAVPPERSGMAASATNTSRELGAVVGVAVLGALVNARLTGDLAAALHRLGIPATFQSLVINAVEHGGVPPSGQASGVGGAAAAGHAQLVQQVLRAAYDAFGAGLHIALVTAAGLVLATAIVAGLTLPRTTDTEPAKTGMIPSREGGTQWL
jgi:EmrB/QacA subfamily drug resistance transporter